MAGGLARDGWHAMGLGRKKLLAQGAPGTAKVLRAEELHEGSNVGNAQLDFTLEVSVDGQAPYELQGLFKIPARLIPDVRADLEVPVRVKPDDPKKVAIDWDAWEAGRGG